jgi:hypothetical protein
VEQHDGVHPRRSPLGGDPPSGGGPVGFPEGYRQAIRKASRKATPHASYKALRKGSRKSSQKSSLKPSPKASRTALRNVSLPTLQLVTRKASWRTSQSVSWRASQMVSQKAALEVFRKAIRKASRISADFPRGEGVPPRGVHSLRKEGSCKTPSSLQRSKWQEI